MMRYREKLKNFQVGENSIILEVDEGLESNGNLQDSIAQTNQSRGHTRKGKGLYKKGSYEGAGDYSLEIDEELKHSTELETQIILQRMNTTHQIPNSQQKSLFSHNDLSRKFIYNEGDVDQIWSPFETNRLSCDVNSNEGKEIDEHAN